MSERTIQVPSVGRIVHYVAHGSADGRSYPSGICRAAIITGVHPETDERESATALDVADICVLNPTGMYFNPKTKYSTDYEPGTWHWPEYVPPIKETVQE